ncbi:MAG: diguanylate cyclase [Thiohalomonadaceae bacterium]
METLQQLSFALDAALDASPLPWERAALLLHALANAGVALAAVLFPAGLAYLALRRRDLEYRGLLWLFAAALLAVGLAHGAAGWDLWAPDPWRSGIAKAGAAALMLLAAIAFLRWLPRARRLPSPSQLRQVNATLSRETFGQQQELRASRARAALYTEAMQRAGTGLALVTPAGGWAEVNPRFLSLLGVRREDLASPADLLGKDYAKAPPECTREWVAQDKSRRLRLGWCPLTREDQHLGWLVECTELPPEPKADDRALTALRAELEDRIADQRRALDAASARLEEEMGIRRQALVQVQRLAEQLMRSNARLNQIDERIGTLARRDPATGLGTRYAFAERLAGSLAGARRYGDPLSLLLLAPDPVEGLSPPAALVAMAKALAGRLRETDVAGVLDEQHLAVLLPHTDAAAAVDAAERFCKAVTASSAGKSPRLSCSVGVAAWRKDQDEETLVREAAEALRRARAAGGGRVAFSALAEAAAGNDGGRK